MNLQQSNLSFRLMAGAHKIRDFFVSPLDVVSEACLESGDRVLDFGCGRGSHSVAAARLVGETGKVLALDKHPAALEMTVRAADNAWLSNVDAVPAWMGEALPDKFLDKVLMYDVYHLLADPAGELRNIHRLLKPGGILSFSDHHTKHSEIVSMVGLSGLFTLEEKSKHTYRFRRREQWAAPMRDALPQENSRPLPSPYPYPALAAETAGIDMLPARSPRALLERLSLY